MPDLMELLRTRLDSRVRDSVWALRSRGDRSVLSAVLRGAMGIPYPARSNREHLLVTMNWLCKAQEETGNGGVSAFYDVREAVWGPAYPETTGYIIPTFFEYAAFSGDEAFCTNAVRMAEWLLTLQLENGAFPIGPLWPEWERSPIVFDTGQIIFGLLRTFEEIGHQKYLEAARRAGDWLVKIQDEDGSWRHFTSLGYEHTYNVRVAWALAQLYKVSADEKYLYSARHNLDWALTQQKSDGWFDKAGFRPEEYPLTHTIAYTIDGFLEAGVLLSEEKFIQAARKAADALLQQQQRNGYLYGRYGPGWHTNVTWSCLTGNAQMAIIWLRLYEMTDEEDYMSAAKIANSYVKRTQSLNASLAGNVGGISGSFPIYGDYEPYRHLNWAAKFFADSLLLEERLHPGQA